MIVVELEYGPGGDGPVSTYCYANCDECGDTLGLCGDTLELDGTMEDRDETLDRLGWKWVGGDLCCPICHTVKYEAA